MNRVHLQRYIHHTRDVGSPILEKQARLLVNGQSSSETVVRNFSPFTGVLFVGN